MEAYQSEDLTGMEQWCDQGLERCPNNPNLLNLKGLALLAREESAAARDFFRRSLNTSPPDATAVAMLKNNIAYGSAMSGNADWLTEADEFSKTALDTLPWLPSFKGTRGVVLVELGRIDEGIALLKSARDGEDDPRGKALNACHLALAEKKRRNLDESRRWRAVATAVNPNSPLPRRLDAEKSGRE